MTTKIVGVLIILSLLGSAATWAVNIVGDRERLEADKRLLIETNEATNRALNFLKNDANIKRQQEVIRTKKIITLTKERKAIEGKLHATQDQLSTQELRCLKSNIPKSRLIILRERTSSATDKLREGMSSTNNTAAHSL